MLKQLEKSLSILIQTVKLIFYFYKNGRNVRTLMTDELFELMLKEEGYTYEEFAYSLQEDIEPVENPEWYNKFLLIIENYDYNNINYDAGINVLTLPFSKYSLDHIKDEKRELTNFRVDEEIFNKLILQQSEELFNLIGKTMALKLAEYKSVSDAQKLMGFLKSF